MEASISRCCHGGHKKKLCSHSTCEHCFQRSLASHVRAPSFEALVNSPNTPPRLVCKGSNQWAFWTCDECSHVFRAQPVDVAVHGQWCPFCANRQICSCAKCYPNSLAATLPTSKRFLSCGDVEDAALMRKTSNKKAKFECVHCKHQFEQTISDAVKKPCKYCSHRAVCEEPDCSFCVPNTIAGDAKLLTLWNDGRPPHSVFRNANFQCSWKCARHGEFTATPNHVQRDGSGCPTCNGSFGERCVADWLSDVDNVVEEWKQPWCRMTHLLRFDFFLTQRRVIVEVDGRQHFEPVAHFGGEARFEEGRRNDLHKMHCAIAQGIPMVRLSATDVVRGSKDWRAWLLLVFRLHVKLRDNRAPLVLQDNKEYRRMYLECMKDDPLLPDVVFVKM